MTEKKEATHYWLFQSSPHIIDIRSALRSEALNLLPVKQHKNAIKGEDKCIIWQAGKGGGCFALGTIISDPEPYQLNETLSLFFHQMAEVDLMVRVKIEYNLWNRPITKNMLPAIPPFDDFFGGLPGTNFTATLEQYEALIEIVNQQDVLEEPVINYEQIPIHQPIPLNVILYGPPACGKTYSTVNYAIAAIEAKSVEETYLEDRSLLQKSFQAYQDEGRIEFVSFHPSYTYEDFIEGIKPQVINNQLQYKVEAGIFNNLSERAMHAYDTLGPAAPNFVFIIDEINRAPLTNVFGELITLLEKDKRKDAPQQIAVRLPYSKKLFLLPPNLHVIGTMNTIDRSTMSIDLALRRRFEFIQMLPDHSLLSNKEIQDVGNESLDLQKLAAVLNDRLLALYGEDYLIGHGFWLEIDQLNELKAVWYNQIIPQLLEYMGRDYKKLYQLLGDGFLTKRQIKLPRREALSDFNYGNNDFYYRLKKAEEVDISNFQSIYQSNS
ncbi:MAG: AAA family ATPase [Bacteroidota bacterium]